jgi:hypothetical protein
MRLALWLHPYRAGGKLMKYIVAWALGVPGILIFLWFVFAHLH